MLPEDIRRTDFQRWGLLVVSGLLVLLVAACAVRRGVVHEVKTGQTLWRISRVYDVKLDTLLAVNDIDDPTAITPGTRITIPGAGELRAVPKRPQRVADGNQTTDEVNSGGTDRGQSSSASYDSPDPPPPADDQNDDGESADRPDDEASSSSNESTSAESSEQEASDSNEPTGKVSSYFDPVWPCDGRIASQFDKNGGPTNRGVRIHTDQGSLVKAAEEGNIKLAGSWEKMPSLGKIVIIFHSHDFTTVYAHMKSLAVSEGGSVERGQTIGRAGRSGEVDRPMCYFEIRYKLEPRDPLIFLGEPT